MSEVKINFLPEEDEPKKRHSSSKLDLKKLIGAAAIILIILLAVFSSSVVFSNESLIKNISKLNLLGQIGKLVLSSERTLKGESDDRINFLLIGMGGKNHEGGTLADTIIVASFKPSTKEAAIMSIPRDLYVKADGFGWMKINAVNAYAEKYKPGTGGEAMSQVLEKILGLPIDYYATVDFDGFERLIDEFGGVDVVVDRDLIDYQYPIRGKEYIYPIENRFEKLMIKKGPQHMDGELALKYSRSRHALGQEGSDFARSTRQQKIIMALREKIFALNTLFNPNKINSLLTAYNEHISTNMQIWEMLKLAQMAKEIDPTKVISFGLAEGPQALLYDQIVNGAYILLPYGGNYDKITYVWQNIFNPEFNKNLVVSKTRWEEFKETTTSADKATSSDELTVSSTNALSATETTSTAETLPTTEKTFQDEKASVAILNGTNINGWASQEKTTLAAKGFNVVSSANAPTRDYTKIAIIDLTGGKNPLTVKELEKIYGVKSLLTLPDGINSSANILLILGK